MTFTMPSVRPMDLALPSAAIGNFPTVTSRPCSLASASVIPAHASSGSVKTTAGTTRLSKAAGSPAITSATTSP